MLGCLMLCQKALGYCDAEHSLKLPQDVTELDLQNDVFVLIFFKKNVRIVGVFWQGDGGSRGVF